MVKLAVIQAAAAFAGITSVALSSPTVTIDSGVLVGVQTSVANSPNIVNAYLGVPFAASPTRFSPPQTPSPFTQPYQANQRGPACIQQFSYPLASAEFSIAAFNTPAPAESEDCLLLQIYAPANATHGSLPVLHWIYGGSLAFGWSGAAAYDGTSFAANQNVVLVASNYRTNVFGFPGPVANLTQPNLGFLDQHFALQWVQRNIAAFGGDPNKVTIFGESAGAFSVDALVTSFNSTTPPPFRGAITESGEISVTPQPPNTGSSWATLISQLNCTQRGFGSDELACARATNASILKNIEEVLALSFNEAVDNNTYIADANRARAEGKIWPTPILTGTNAQEGSIFTSAYNDTTAYLNTTIPGLTAGQIAAIKSFYPIGSYGVNGRLIANQMQQISAIFTDLVFQCPCAIVSNTSVSANIPAWRYFYNSTFANIVLIPGVTLPFKPGVYHSSEIALVFGTYPIYTTNGGPTAQQMRVSEYMQDAWATFARNPQGGPGWPSSAQGGYVHSIGGDGGFPERGYGLTTSSSASALDDGRCALYEPVYQIVSGG